MKKYTFTDKQGVPHIVVAASIEDAVTEIKRIDGSGYTRFNMIAKLIESEQTAVTEYELALESCDNDKDREVITHILNEEKEHIKMLEAIHTFKEE